MKENLEVRFEWSLHDWLLLPLLCGSRDRKIREEIFSTQEVTFIIRHWGAVGIFTTFIHCDQNLFR